QGDRRQGPGRNEASEGQGRQQAGQQGQGRHLQGQGPHICAAAQGGRQARPGDDEDVCRQGEADGGKASQAGNEGSGSPQRSASRTGKGARGKDRAQKAGDKEGCPRKTRPGRREAPIASPGETRLGGKGEAIGKAQEGSGPVCGQGTVRHSACCARSETRASEAK